MGEITTFEYHAGVKSMQGLSVFALRARGQTPMMTSDRDAAVTFVGDDGEIVINFGILCGREATQAEIDRLAQALNDDAGAGPDITIIATRRQDYGHGIETVTHQVHVAPTGVLSALPETVCRSWVERCAAERRVEPLSL